MDKPKPITDMHEKIKDVMSNLTAIKGERFARAAFLCFLSAHTTQMIGTILRGLPEGMELAREAAGHQLAYTLANSLAYMMELGEFTQADADELVRWSETMQSHVTQAIKESS